MNLRVHLHPLRSANQAANLGVLGVNAFILSRETE